ncbi:MAG: FeoA domain-containing protein [Erysipelotrichaceae bacterium]|nr:FeoA domain-containing protein [Erysipelotrichaceae bacterium]
MDLKDAQIGHDYKVLDISLPINLERRLEALGMTKETTITVQNRKGKGILIIKLRGTRFALGLNITENIKVEEVI